MSEHSTDAELTELRNGLYMEIAFSYDSSMLVPVKDGCKIIKAIVKGIPLARKYNKPPVINQKTDYPRFILTTGASIKEERLTHLLENP